MSADNSAQIKSSKQALIYVCGFIAKKLNTKVPGLVKDSEDKTNCDWIDLKSRGSLVYPSKDLLEEVEKYFKKYMESHWIEVEIQSKKQFQLLLQ